jgi:hypothetical protein
MATVDVSGNLFVGIRDRLAGRGPARDEKAT